MIQRLIEDPLSEELLRLKHGPGDAVVIDVDAEGEITMNLKPKAKKEKKEKTEATAAAAGSELNGGHWRPLSSTSLSCSGVVAGV